MMKERFVYVYGISITQMSKLYSACVVCVGRGACKLDSFQEVDHILIFVNFSYQYLSTNKMLP